MRISALIPFLAWVAFSAVAYPQLGFHRRADEDPGIGVELEWEQGQIKNPNPKAVEAKDDDEILKKVKGKALIVEGRTTFTDRWKLTAEHDRLWNHVGISSLMYEWIVLGEVVKLSPGENDLILPGIGREILSSMVCEQSAAKQAQTLPQS